LCAKVRYIIDRNPDCLTGKLGIEVITPEQLAEYDIDIVVKTSPPPNKPELAFLSCEEIKERLAREKAKVLDIYEYLTDNAVICTTDFWDREFADEDMEVGFLLGETP
jgi:hypothetical protein